MRAAIAKDHRVAEADIVRRLRALQPGAGSTERIQRNAARLAGLVRAAPPGPFSAESFLRHYGLSTREGVALMCVAEALLRIPDSDTADALLVEKFSAAQWEPAQEGSLASNATEWALLLTGTLARWHADDAGGLRAQLRQLTARLGEPFVRAAVRGAMRILAEQFVLAESIEKAVARAAGRRPYLFSYDMLGEAARTAEDAASYLESYAHAIEQVKPPDSISVKLSALHPRFEEAKRTRVLSELLPKVRTLCELAAKQGVSLTIDAEESERLELTLDIFDALTREFQAGLAVQAYQKRALAVCEWLAGLRRRIGVRLVKGAYWDGEVKRAQQLGMPDYPVFTRKGATDLSYIACATRLLAAPGMIFPAFATHNCRTAAAILELCGDGTAGSAAQPFEFQKLLGMGDALYNAIVSSYGVPVRVYAPVGSFTDLLPYLVRRLLENGANTSFVHQIADPDVPVEALIADPAETLPDPCTPDPRIPLPRELYPDRRNSAGYDLSVRENLEELRARIATDRAHALPRIEETSHSALDALLARASEAFEHWSRVPARERAAMLERAADVLEGRMLELVSLIVREGRRTYADAVSEVREAADFCRYYALQAKLHFEQPQRLAGPAGERNELGLHGRGVFACISPWNFPVAIFTGQVVAALAAGNTVIAKPAEQTPRLGLRVVEILREAGIPEHVAACAVGGGESIGAALVSESRVNGVAFTGSMETARRINQALAKRPGPFIPLIAETGGVNAMIVDASALPEQVVDDVLVSAFQSAGQRCSSQRILFVEEGCAPRVLRLLSGALAQLKVGDPAEPDTDVGPIIDAVSHAALARHVDELRKTARLIGEARLPSGLPGDHYLAPIAFELPIDALPRVEIFGPILHVATYRRTELDAVLAWLRATGYGLTLGVHSRIEGFADEVVRGSLVGNIYVNRNMIGAVVGVQPFGGEGLSGTGPKAGGPHYLLQFATERTLTVNTAAVGGVTELLSGSAEDQRAGKATGLRHGVLQSFLALTLLSLVAGVSWARPPLPPPDVRAAPGKPGWSVDDRTGCWIWNASPESGQTAHWSEGCSPVGRAMGRGVLEWRAGGSVTRYEGELRYGVPNGHGIYTAPNGERYEGEFRDGKRNGRGVLTWGDGERYAGDFRDGAMHGDGDYTEAGGNRYIGAFRDDQREGAGTYTWANGDRYVGEFRAGKRHGRGVYTWVNGDRYEGEFLEGNMHGEGVMVRANGERYEGGWREGIRHGQGVMTGPDGGRYQGEWREDEWNGRGVWTTKAFRYEGEFRDGQPEGQGVTVLPDGQRMTGEYRAGRLHGSGEITLASGSRYKGEFRKGLIHGDGVFTWANGDRFKGHWREGRADGHGVYRAKSGKVFEGKWIDGCFRQGDTRIAIGRPAKDCR